MHQLLHVERIFIPYNVQVCKPQLVAMVAENLYDTTMLAEIPPHNVIALDQHPLWQQHYDSIVMWWGASGSVEVSSRQKW